MGEVSELIRLIRTGTGRYEKLQNKTRRYETETMLQKVTKNLLEDNGWNLEPKEKLFELQGLLLYCSANFSTPNLFLKLVKTFYLEELERNGQKCNTELQLEEKRPANELKRCFQDSSITICSCSYNVEQ